MWSDRLDATIYTCTNESVATDVRKLIKNKKISQDSLLKRINQTNPLNLTVKSDKFEKTENSVIDQIQWKKGVTKNMPINNTIVFVKAKKVLKAEPKKLNEIRGIVTSDYQTFLEKQWLDELRKKYSVSVNEPVLKSLIKK
jgi:peptidyl-prolyl cis-trans isomerase SurA